MAFVTQKGNGNWYLVDKSFKPPRWIKLGLIRKHEAREVLLRYQVDSTYLRLGLPVPPTKITLYELLDEYFSNFHGQPATKKMAEGYLLSLCKQLGSHSLHQVQAEHIHQYFEFKEYSPNTRRIIRDHLMRAFNLAVDRKYITENPIKKLPRPKIKRGVPKFVDPTVLDDLVTHMKGPVKNYYLILRYTGMRPAEPLKLRVCDIKNIEYKDLKTGEMHRKDFIKIFEPKKGTERLLPIHPNLFAVLAELCAGKKHTDYLFPGKKPGEHQKSMKSALERLKRKLGVDICRYTFRRTVAMDILAKTGDISAVQSILGHESVTTTEFYARALKAAQVRAIEVL